MLRHHHRRFSWKVAMLSVLLLLSGYAGVLAPAAVAAPIEPAIPNYSSPTSIVIFQEPRPNLAVRPNDVVVNTVTVRNQGPGEATSTSIILPYSERVVEIISVTFAPPDRTGAWVRSVRDGRLTIETGLLVREGRSGDRLTIEVTARVLGTAPLGRQPFGRLLYRWKDSSGFHDRAGNLPLLTVGETTRDQELYPLSVATTDVDALRFASTIFLPDEPVTAWYTTPDGANEEVAIILADETGAVQLVLDREQQADLAAGTYQMVLRGNRTALTAQGTFTVE